MKLSANAPPAAIRSAAASALAAVLLFSPLQPPAGLLPQLNPAVQAKELASGSGSRVNKDPESLLRLGLPSQPKQIREVQAGLEESNDNLQRFLYGQAKGALAKSKGALSKPDAILKAVPASGKETAAAYIKAIDADVDTILSGIASGDNSGALKANEDSLKQLSKLEELIASEYVVPKPPSEFAGLPYLKGRAQVEFIVKRPGAKFDVDGNLYNELKIVSTVDGFASPITAGNFVDLVQRGFYNGMKVQRSDGFVVQTGDPSKENGDKGPNGFVAEGSEKVRKIPLEVYVQGDKAPIYGSTFDDDGRGGYAARLPFNAYGALGMAREEYDADSASSQWFWLLFDSDLTPAGKNLLDGRYSCFGYTTEGARLLSDVKEGDVIASAKVLSGLDLLDKV